MMEYNEREDVKTLLRGKKIKTLFVLKEERYAPPKRSITPEESTFAGEAVVAGDGVANASTVVKQTTGKIVRHPRENETMSPDRWPLRISSLTAGGKTADSLNS